MKRSTQSKKQQQCAKQPSPVYARIREILESARVNVARSVNTTQVVANWLVGREIVEEEQQGADRAQYGKQLIETLSKQLTKDYGPGYSVQSLFYIKQFYLAYPKLLPQAAIFHAARGKTGGTEVSEIFHAARGESSPDSATSAIAIPHASRAESPQRSAGAILQIPHPLRSESPRNKASAKKFQHAPRVESSTDPQDAISIPHAPSGQSSANALPSSTVVIGHAARDQS